MSGQHWENYDFKREIVHYCPQNVDRCCTWHDVVAGISARFSKFAFVLFCYITNPLMTGPLGNSEFCFSRISFFPSTSSRKTLRFSGNKIHCFPRDQSLRVNSFMVFAYEMVNVCNAEMIRLSIDHLDVHFIIS